MKVFQLTLFAAPMLFCTILTGQTSQLLTDNPLKSKIDKIVHKQAAFYMKDSSANGLSIGILSKGRRHIYNYGETKKNTGKLPTADNFYGLGSIDKVFATTLLANAVIKGKVSLEDDIRKYLSGGYPNLVFDNRPIKLVNLANHTSGLPRSFRTYPSHIRDSLRGLDLKGQVGFYNLYSRDSLLYDLRLIELDTLPSAKYNYNNNDIKVLIVLLENMYDRPYGEILREYLQDSLNMYNTKTELSPEEKGRAATGYFKGNPEEFVNFKGFIAGPTVISTVNDMLRFIEVSLEAKDEAFLLTQKLTWGNQEGYGLGLGWMMDYEKNGDRYIYHTGNTRLGFNAVCQFYPDKDWGIVIFANDTSDLQKLAGLVDGIHSELVK